MDSNVISLQIIIAGIHVMKRMGRIVRDPHRTYACTRTAVRVTVAPLSKEGVLTYVS
jgi:hypothetical protein